MGTSKEFIDKIDKVLEEHKPNESIKEKLEYTFSKVSVVQRPSNQFKYDVIKNLGAGWSQTFAKVYQTVISNINEVNRERGIDLQSKFCYAAYFINTRWDRVQPEISPTVTGLGNTPIEAVENLYTEYKKCLENLWKDKLDFLN